MHLCALDTGTRLCKESSDLCGYVSRQYCGLFQARDCGQVVKALQPAHLHGSGNQRTKGSPSLGGILGNQNTIQMALRGHIAFMSLGTDDCGMISLVTNQC